ncbi:unnamed protein product [Adineta steineri]|uniref:Meiosis regulator and mRNA stability factor 1 n=1 Tax=Adineta steineri TaxID=433720 RepID=A0A814UQ70_9BILA|nr:unnamed protein product [Adineta steineri]CAF1318937.1 unnamed protein product [Adineta steineri]
MALCSDRFGINVSCGENVTSMHFDDDSLVKLITNEIIEILQLDEDEIGCAVIKDLLENGRQSLVKYKDDIIPKVYNEVMNGTDTRLTSSLKNYFRLKWEILYGSAHSWFISFLQQYENGENHDIYEAVLARTAEYGNKYMNDYPLLSIILQFLFESIDDDCLEGKDNVFDDLWTTITNDGLQLITKYSEYIVKKVLNEQLKTDSVLFKVVREYYRPNCFLSLTQSSIPNKGNIYELALDDVVEHGWLSNMKSIQHDITPRRYETLLKNLHSFYKKQKLSENEDSSGSVAPALKTDVNDVQQESSIETSESNINQLEIIDAKQNVISTNEPLADTTTDIDVLNHATTTTNIENKDAQKDKQEQEDNESNVSYDSKTNSDGTDNMFECSKNTIFISGLPANMSKERLFDKVKDVFSTCGNITTYGKTNKPDIHLFPKKDNRSILNGTAMVKFEKEDSVMKAIEKYNRKQVPALDNKQINVRFGRVKREKIEILSKSTEPKPKAKDHFEKDQNTIYTEVYRQQPKRDQSVSSNGSLNRVTDSVDTPISRKSVIFVTGLPTNMLEQRLFDTLWDEFSNVGSIKINRKTSRPCICLFKTKGLKPQLTGAGMITFENEESVEKATKIYNAKQVSLLNNNQITAKRFKIGPAKPTQSFEPRSQLLLQPPSVQMPRPEDQPDGPVSIFWDIENVPIPAGNDAFEIVRKLRQRLISDRKLSEGTFKTYYRNANHILPEHRTNLHYANVLAQHIESIKYGAVDIQIHKDLQRFIEQHKTSATVVLISGDIDFINDINELRYRHKHYTIIIHNPQAKEQLLKTANEFIPWEEFIEKKCNNESRKQCTFKTSKNLSKEVKQSQIFSVAVLTDKLTRIASPKQNLDKTRTSTPPLQRPPSIASNSPTNAKPSQEKRHRNKTKPSAQSPVPLVLLTNETEKSEKKNKPAEVENLFVCSMCTRKFPTDAGRIQHEQDKHKVGTLVDIFSTTSTNDTQNHSQSSNHDNLLYTDLIALTYDDDDDDDWDLSQPNLSTVTTGTNLPVEDISDGDSDASESSFTQIE